MLVVEVFDDWFDNCLSKFNNVSPERRLRLKRIETNKLWKAFGVTMRIFENPVIPFNFEVYQQGKHMAYLSNGTRIHAIGLVNFREGDFILARLINGSNFREALFTLEGVCVGGRFENIVLEEIRCEKDN